MYEDLYERKAELEFALEEAETTRERAPLLKQLESLQKALGEEELVEDELWEQWERELSEGKEPDLDQEVRHG